MTWLIKLFKLLIKIPYDKLFHSYIGYIISDIIFVISPLQYWINLCISVGVVSIIAISKELFDKFVQKESMQFTDIIATICGGLFNCLISLL